MHIGLFLIILIYFILIFIIGAKTKEIKGLSGFVKAQSSLGILAVFAGLVMTHYGGGFVLGGGEWGFLYSFKGAIYGFSAGLGLLILGIFLAKKFQKLAKPLKDHKKGIYTIPDFLRFRYKNNKIAIIAAVLSTISLVGIGAAQIFAAGRIFSAIGIDSTLGEIIITLFIIFVAAKGIKTLTRVGQYNILIATIGGICALVFVFLKVGGITAFANQVKEINFVPLSMPEMLWVLIPTVMYTLIGQDFHQKIFSAKSKFTARTAAIFAGLFLIGFAFIPTILGISAKILYPDITPSEAIPAVIVNIFNENLFIVKGFFVAAILAAVMGSAQSVLNAAASHVSKDLYPLIKKEVSDKDLYFISRFSVVILSVFALFVALISKSIINTIVLAYTLYTAGIFIPIIMGVFWKKASAKGALYGAIAGILISGLGEFKIINLGIPPIIIGAFVSFVIMVLLGKKTVVK